MALELFSKTKHRGEGSRIDAFGMIKREIYLESCLGTNRHLGNPETG